MEPDVFYVGVKIVSAWKQEKDGKPGYGVRYPDGYVSWSPKDTFEAAYLPMGEQDNRVTPEMVDLITGRQWLASDMPDGKTTLVQSVMATGFVEYATSSCVDPANYDSILGSELALKKIKDVVWKCLGFVVQWGKCGMTPVGINKAGG